MTTYRVHMVSFRNQGDLKSFNTLIRGERANVQQIEELEKFIVELRENCPEYGKDIC